MKPVIVSTFLRFQRSKLKHDLIIPIESFLTEVVFFSLSFLFFFFKTVDYCRRSI